MTDEERKQAAIEVLPESLYDAVRYLNEDKFICDVLGEHITSKYTEAKLREWNDYRLPSGNLMNTFTNFKN